MRKRQESGKEEKEKKDGRSLKEKKKKRNRECEREDRKEECDREKRKEEKKMGIEENDRKKKKEADEKAVEEERRKKIKEGRRGRKEEEEDKHKNRESSAKDALPPPDAFPSRKLGNNMTPIKGRLGKNTTPTHGGPEKLIQRHQRNPSRDSRTSSIHPMRASSTRYEKQNLRKRRIQRQQNHHL